MNSIRVILYLAGNFDWPLQLLDVKYVFLHGDLEEEVYMKLSIGPQFLLAEGKGCKLIWAWFERFLSYAKYLAITKVMAIIHYSSNI
jgi:hypothetical protein